MKFLFGRLWKSFPQAVEKQLLRKVRQLERLPKPLLGSHVPQDFDVPVVIGAGFGVHAMSFKWVDAEAKSRANCFWGRWFVND